jgi:hypothetical protein
MAEPFPETVEKGAEYGQVEPVMIDADIYGWASSVAAGGRLSSADRARLRQAADELENSIGQFPVGAQPYFRRLLDIAEQTLGKQ